MKRLMIYANDEGLLDTDEIDESINDLKATSVNDIDSYLHILSKCVDSFKADYSKIPKGVDGLDIRYDDQKHYVYLHYKPLADECKRVLSNLNITGYGRYDLLKIKIQNLCRFVDYNFPYGWKNC